MAWPARLIDAPPAGDGPPSSCKAPRILLRDYLSRAGHRRVPSLGLRFTLGGRGVARAQGDGMESTSSRRYR